MIINADGIAMLAFNSAKLNFRYAYSNVHDIVIIAIPN